MADLEIKDIITLFIGIISIVIPSYIFFVTSPNEIKTPAIIVFIGIVIFIMIAIPIFYIYKRWVILNKIVKDNNKELKELREDLKNQEASFQIEKRLSIMENIMHLIIKNKKSQIKIDPRIIFWILLLLLLLLFLKTAGFFG